MLTWDLIDHLNLAISGQISTNHNASSATGLAPSVLGKTITNVKDALMDITCQEQLATSVMLIVLPALEENQLNVPDATRDTF